MTIDVRQQPTDDELLLAGIAIAAWFLDSGSALVPAVIKIAKTNPDLHRGLDAAMNLLGVREAAGVYNQRVLRLRQLGLEIATKSQADRVIAESAIPIAIADELPTFERLGTKPATRTYRIDVSHAEQHVIGWAYRLAEAVVDVDEEKIKEAREIYISSRADVNMEHFIGKLDEAHLQARNDDGELN